jgi:aromatic-L-amino-acid decarboxylase
MLAAMDTEEFRRHTHAFVDWMADYLAGVERYPVRAPVKPCQGTPRGKPLGHGGP